MNSVLPKVFMIAVLLIVGCSNKTHAEYANSARWFGADFPTEFGPVKFTPGGIPYYAPRDNIVEAEFDFMFDTVDQCVRDAVPEGTVNPADEHGCTNHLGPITYTRDVVIVIGPWHLNCAGTEQVLDVKAPQIGCDAKGIPKVCSEHPDRSGCHWRSGVAEARSWYEKGTLPVINVPPRGFMLPDALVSLWVPCSNVWIAEKLRRCARPLVAPL